MQTMMKNNKNSPLKKPLSIAERVTGRPAQEGENVRPETESLSGFWLGPDEIGPNFTNLILAKQRNSFAPLINGLPRYAQGLSEVSDTTE